MTGKFIFRCCITLLALTAITVTSPIIGNSASQAKVSPPTGEQVKTVEQVKKNIQVLKGLPASQLDIVMNYMASSLGVKCNPKGSSWPGR